MHFHAYISCFVFLSIKFHHCLLCFPLSSLTTRPIGFVVVVVVVPPSSLLLTRVRMAKRPPIATTQQTLQAIVKQTLHASVHAQRPPRAVLCVRYRGKKSSWQNHKNVMMTVRKKRERES